MAKRTKGGPIKTLKDFLDVKCAEALVQAYIPTELYRAVKAASKKQGHTVKQIIVAAFKQYLSEFGPK